MVSSTNRKVTRDKVADLNSDLNSCGYGWRADKIDSNTLRCMYCGSLRVEDAIRYLKQPGTRFSGADWKYGWPHKFYLEPVNPEADKEVEVGGSYENGVYTPTMGKRPHLYFKFYNSHLKEATDEQLKEFSELSTRSFGIAWGRDEKGIFYRAPRTNSFYGWQLWGDIDAEGQPDHARMRAKI